MRLKDSANSRRKQKNVTLIIAAAFLSGALLGAVLFKTYNRIHQAEKTQASPYPETVQATGAEESAQDSLSDSSRYSSAQPSAARLDTVLVEVGQEDSGALPVTREKQTPPPPVSFPAEDRCEKFAEELHLFFVELDHRPYIEDLTLTGSAQEHFITLAHTLLESPPVVSRETDDLYTILSNTAHFFRILGKDNIAVLKAVWDRERDRVEDVALTLYQWMHQEQCTNEVFPLQVSLEKVYEYAGFFLNTMGGRSYLFRRDASSRLLVTYYSVLIVALADEQGLNRYGINLAEVLPLLIEETENSNQLIYKELYLDRLYELAERYQ